LSALGLAAVLTALSFLYPPFFPCAWVAWVPFFRSIEQLSDWRKALWAGWLTGAVATAIGFYWLTYTIQVFGGFSLPPTALIFILFVIYSGLPFAIMAALVKVCGFGPLFLFPALFWVALEYSFPYLFPWHLAGSQSAFLSLIQTADLLGPHGTSLQIVWCNTLLHAIFVSDLRRRSLFVAAAAFGVTLAAALFYGRSRIAEIDRRTRSAPTLEIAAVQGSVDIERKWAVAYLASNLRSYLDLTAAIEQADLVLWPESAVEAWLPDEMPALSSEILPALPRGAFFIFGARSFVGVPGTPDLKAYNSAFLTDSKGRVLGRYHKQVLLAFGEYLPFGALLSRVPGVPPLGEGFSAGVGPITLDLPPGVRIGPLICYEDLMPNLARRLVAEKEANLLVNLTNDAWFGDGAAPWQHARLAQWRAIETRRTLIRVTNTGLTSLIDASGRLTRTAPLFSPQLLRAPAAILAGQTFYVRYGDWFPWLITSICLAILLRRSLSAARSGKKSKRWSRADLSVNLGSSTR
jgi:apolipoprotein N-acyltransferase